MSSNCSIALLMSFKYNKIKKMKKVIIMNRHDDKARELFKQGYNCSQAVVLSFADELPIDFDSLVKISASFGGGIGRMREICGAFSGVCMVIGMLLSNADTNKPDKKKEHYEIVQAFAEEFKKRNGSYRCYELLGIELKKEDGYYVNATYMLRYVAGDSRPSYLYLIGNLADGDKFVSDKMVVFNGNPITSITITDNTNKAKSQTRGSRTSDIKCWLQKLPKTK